MSSTPAAARASASLVFCTHTPTAPAARCSRAIAAHLCIFACGLQAHACGRGRSRPWRRRLRSIASRSITSAGVSIDADRVADLRHGGSGRRAHRRAGADRHHRVALAAVVERHLAFEVRGVAPADQGEAARRVEQPVDRGVAELPRARRAELDAGGGAIEAVEHAAVGDDGDRAAGLAGGDAAAGRDGAGAELAQGLAALGRRSRDRDAASAPPRPASAGRCRHRCSPGRRRSCARAGRCRW